jgi:hypothetical protein
MAIPTSLIARSSKIYPNWDFGFENMPSGIPDSKQKLFVKNFATQICGGKEN